MYLSAPTWQKDSIDQRLYIVTETVGMSKAEAMSWCEGHGYDCSMATIYRWRRLYREGGKNALATGYGNRKDYRGKDFAGGRKVTASVNEEQTSSLMPDLGIKPWFALPYNAQRKPIERTFRTFHNEFERNLSAGYTGTNSVKRPEVLKEQVKRGQLTDVTEFTALVDTFIKDVFNKREFTHTAIHAGKSPDEIWAADNPVLRRASAKPLAVFMQRTSKQLRIGRNGVRDTQLGVTYWAEEFGNQSLIGSYCYLRPPLYDSESSVQVHYPSDWRV